MGRMMRFLAGLAAVVLAHAVGVRLHPEFPQAVDLFIVLVVLHGLDGRSAPALAGGLAAGMVQDALTGGLFGLYGCADTIIGYGTARASQRLVIDRAGGVLPLAAVAAVVQQVVVVGLATAMLPDPRLPDPLWLIVRAVSSGLLATLLYAGGGWWRRDADRRKRRRRERLQLG